MRESPTPVSVPGPPAEAERQKIRQQFEAGTSARETLLALCDLADHHVRQIFDEVLRVQDREPEGLCLLALGGYGRRMLFPYSDLDILFLFGSERTEQEFRPLISEFSRTLWDLGFRVSSAGRTLEECKRIEEDNAEFHLALLDRRFLAGDSTLFEKLDEKVLPGSEKQARPFLLAQLHKLTRDRLTRYGNTIFHLEPNVKDSPGGMRDYQAIIWLRQLSEEKKGIRNITAAEEELSALSDRTVTYSLFAEAAGTGTPLSREAERSIGYVLIHPELPPKNTEMCWEKLREILGSDYPGLALRPMQRLGLLTEILPEFGLIDSLVVRDFYHRYTVDEHTLRTIEHLQELADPPDERGAHFIQLWKTVDRRDLLILALLLHDVGKGMPVGNHVTGSLAALDSAAKRLRLSPEEKAEIRSLIEHHLEMSATVQRRDIFDPATVAGFAESVTNLERLQRLCLLTYADIHAVNPEALTPWKAEMLWQLFVATSNYFSRTLDRDRLHAHDEVSLLGRIKACAGDGASNEEIERFLDGFPRRYLAVHSPQEIAGHLSLYRKLSEKPVQTQVTATRHGFALTLLTPDRPVLFATISGVLAGWGMNINKADAFANAAGIILDTFHFTDLHRTLELNPSEIARFRKSLEDVLNGKSALEPLLKGRVTAIRGRTPKVTVPTHVNFDDSSSAHCTLLEIVTQDPPGLLYEMGSALARQGCNIEVALIDTEGHKAIDVFYLTAQGKKLTPQKQELLREVLQGTLG